MTGDFIDTEINPSPIAKKLTDVRSYQSLQMIDTKRVLNNTVDRVIKNMNQGVKTSDIIKNDN